jgi:formylglycine-generating enzyme required for sulfatase activity/CheY-like chemotaxis protein
MPQYLRWQSSTQAFIEPLGEGQALTMLRIPAGRFLMGSPDHESERDDDEGPLHEVEIQEFLMAATPITQAQWRAVAGWTERQGESWRSPLPLDPSLFQEERARLIEGESDTSQRPVERISWEEAMEFCRRLSQRTRRRYTLPSEAQWEYACRAGSTAPYAFGTELTAELANLGQQTTPVPCHPANAWGLREMHGNVWEWCLDHWHDSYFGAPIDGTAWMDANAPATTDRVVRGGPSWSDSPSAARSAGRLRMPSQSPKSVIVGFRVVCLPAGEGGQPDSPALDRQALVVWMDDRQVNHRRERDALEGEGVRLQLASSIEEVMAMLASAPVDLVIVDLHRHDGFASGLQMVRQMRAGNVFVSVIFYADLVSNAWITAALEAGVFAVINQPDQLRKAMRSVLAGTIA